MPPEQVNLNHESVELKVQQAVRVQSRNQNQHQHQHQHQHQRQRQRQHQRQHQGGVMYSNTHRDLAVVVDVFILEELDL